MTDYRNIRHHLSRTRDGMALLLGLNGDNAEHMIYEFETGKRKPTGPIQQHYENWEKLLFVNYNYAFWSATILVQIRRGELTEEEGNEALQSLAGGAK